MRSLGRRRLALASGLAGCLTVGVACAPGRPQGAEPLYSAEINVTADGTGKDLIMRLDEVERRGGASVVRVRRQEGASVPSIMFVAKGLYEMAKLRRAKYFVSMKQWRDEEGNWMYMVAFTSSRDVDLRRLYGKDCEATIDETSFMSVEDYDLLWGGER